MRTKTNILRIAALFALGPLGIAFGSNTQAAKEVSASLADDAALVQRGEFLVHNVVLCVDCHSPRDDKGEFISSMHLRGAPMPFAPIVPMPEWGPVAPPIAGLPAGWSEEAMLQFLTTGVRPNGLPFTRPPMPPYRLEAGDAKAVVAYLKWMVTADHSGHPK